MDILEMLEKRKIYLEMVQRSLLSREKTFPEGTLEIEKCRGVTQYYHRKSRGERHGKYLPAGESEIAKLLAQKDYDKKVMKAVNQELGAICRCIRKYPKVCFEEIYSFISEDRQKLIHPLYEDDESFVKRWTGESYEGKPFPDGLPELFTGKGERVRSKSEVIIANLLAGEDIPYKYEHPVRLKGFGVIYPDFTVLNMRTRKDYYWEHLGMMDDAEYVESVIRKLSAYSQNRIFPGERLILTAETRNIPLDVRGVKRLINHFFR